MQPQDPYGPRPAYPPQGPPQGAPQPQMPGQPNGPGFNAGQTYQPQNQNQPYSPPLPTYQAPAGGPNPTAPKPPNLTPPPDAPESPYDFFMQQPKHISAVPLPAKGKLLGNKPLNPGFNGGGIGGKKNMLIFLAAGAVGLVLIVMAFIAFAPKDQSGPQFFGIVQTQQELIRVCGQGTSRAKYQSTRNLAATCSAGIANSQKQLLAYMSKAKLSYDSKLIGAKANSQTDSKLSQAVASSSYDAVFRTVVEAQLKSYDRAITAQLAATTGVNGREVLTKNEKSAALLMLMASDDSDKTEAATTE